MGKAYPDCMAGEAGFWGEISQKIIGLVSKEEVKTPLSLCFRMTLLILLLAVAALYQLESSEFRLQIFEITIAVLLAIWLSVLIVAWFRPKHLVFGESGHRAETKFAFGSDKKTLSYEQVSSLPSTTPRDQLPEGEVRFDSFLAYNFLPKKSSKRLRFFFRHAQR